MKSKRAQEAVSAAEDKPADDHSEVTPANKKRKRGEEETEVVDSGKKAKKDKKKKKQEKESRKEKKDKLKDLQDLPEGDDDADETADKDDTAEKEEKKAKKSKKDKKDKKADETAETPKKKSKKAKKESAATENGDAVGAEDAIPNGASNGIDLDMSDEAGQDGDQNGEDAGKDEKADRHIVFVGNLPYTATAASISAHFASLSPIAVRCLTNKGDTKHTCKGIAFVEFANVWTQRTCLDRFHHSMFDDGQSAARKINVELTAGGGGKGANRQEKINEKNRKLDENRAKRIEKEKTGKTEAAKADGTMEEQQAHMDEQIHPSRRAQMGSDAPEDDFNSHNGNGGGGRRGGGWGGGRGGGRGRGGRGRGGGGRGRGGWSR